jgi:hypothetical protein
MEATAMRTITLFQVRYSSITDFRPSLCSSLRR